MSDHHPPFTATQSAASVAVLAIIIAISAASGYRMGSTDGAAGSDKALTITRKALNDALKVADSAHAANLRQHRNDSIAWSGYVAQVRAAGHDSLQAALRRLAVRRSAEVAQRIPDSPLRAPLMGDLAQDRDSACTVTLPCDQAADLLAGDSLRTIVSDSLAGASRVAVAACSVSVLSERLRGDSLAALPPRKAPWTARAADIATGAGIMATVFAILGIVW